MPLPLEGIRVLDLTNVMAGPYCTMVLGDLGAEIIKLESLEGDSTRNFEPKVNDESYCFAVLNRNKKSIAVDMKAPAGKEIVMKMAARCDIVIENFRPGVVKKLGIEYNLDWVLDDMPCWMRTKHGPLICMRYGFELNDSLVYTVERQSSPEILQRLEDTLETFGPELKRQPRLP